MIVLYTCRMLVSCVYVCAACNDSDTVFVACAFVACMVMSVNSSVLLDCKVDERLIVLISVIKS